MDKKMLLASMGLLGLVQNAAAVFGQRGMSRPRGMGSRQRIRAASSLVRSSSTGVHPNKLQKKARMKNRRVHKAKGVRVRTYA